MLPNNVQEPLLGEGRPRSKPLPSSTPSSRLEQDPGSFPISFSPQQSVWRGGTVPVRSRRPWSRLCQPGVRPPPPSTAPQPGSDRAGLCAGSSAAAQQIPAVPSTPAPPRAQILTARCHGAGRSPALRHPGPRGLHRSPCPKPRLGRTLAWFSVSQTPLSPLLGFSPSLAGSPPPQSPT